MLSTNTMPSANYAPFQQRECGFNGVRVNVAFHVNPEAVSDDLMSAIFANISRSAPVRFPIVGEQNIHIIGDILADVLFERSRFNILSMEEAEFAATLSDSYDNLFIIPAVIFALSAIHAADKGFIHFYLAAQLGPIGLNHCGADSVTEIPCRLVSLDSKRALNLARAHALFSFTQQNCRKEPCSKREMSIMEDCIYGNAELVFA